LGGKTDFGPFKEEYQLRTDLINSYKHQRITELYDPLMWKVPKKRLQLDQLFMISSDLPQKMDKVPMVIIHNLVKSQILNISDLSCEKISQNQIFTGCLTR